LLCKWIACLWSSIGTSKRSSIDTRIWSTLFFATFAR
jgi:hypothetical protein